MPAGNPGPALPPAGSMQWHAWLYTPPSARALVAAALALDAELRPIAHARAEHGVAHLKLQWWREEVQRLEQGVPRHPLTQAALAAAGAGMGWRPFQDLLTSLELDLASSTYETEAELDRYLALAAGPQRAMAQLLVPSNDRVAQFAGAAGQCIRGIEIIRDLRQDAAHGRIYLPLAWLEGEGIDHAELRAARLGVGLVRCLARLAEISREQGRRAREAVSGGEYAALRGQKVLLALHLALLDRIERRRFDVARQRHSLSPMLGLWTAWRAARQH
ncbi:MAG: squalene/phytoene synthase family protein [Steroidobacteraceae bacterium]